MLTTWTVSYQTTQMGIFEWIQYAIFIDERAAAEAALEVFIMNVSKEEIVNVRIRKEIH